MTEPLKDRATPPLVSIIGSLPPVKGISPYCEALVQALCEVGPVEFIGFNHIYPEALYPGGPRSHRPAPQIKNLHNRSFLDWFNPLGWVWAGLTLKGQVVHAQWWSFILAPVYIIILGIARLRRKKIVMTVHNVRPHERAKWKLFLNRSVLRLAHAYIVHSQDNRERFIEETKTTKPVHVIRHGLLALNRPQPEAARSRLGLKKNEDLVLLFGNLRPYKGAADLIRATTFIHKRDVRFCIAGKPWVDMKSIWQDTGPIIEKDGRIQTMLGFLPDEEAADLFSAASVVVFPYTAFDAFSGVAGLALYFGKPVVVSQTGGLPEIASSPKVIVPPENPAALAEAITYALGNQGSLASAQKELALGYQWPAIAQATVGVYRSVCKSSESKKKSDQ